MYLTVYVVTPGFIHVHLNLLMYSNKPTIGKYNYVASMIVYVFICIVLYCVRKTRVTPDDDLIKVKKTTKKTQLFWWSASITLDNNNAVLTDL